MPSRPAFFQSLVVAAVLAISSLQLSDAAEYSVQKISDEQSAGYDLDTSFYSKVTPVEGILIATSDKVSDLAHLEAAYQFGMIMQRISPPIAQRIRDKKVLCILIGHKELTSQLPQFASKKTGKELDFYNWRSRGFLTHKNGRPTVVFAEEDVLEYEGGMQIESILIHEFGHVIHGAGFDKGLQDRLTECFENVKQSGIWNDGRAAQRFRRVKGKIRVSLFDELVKSFSDQSPALIKACLDGGDILVNGKPTNSKVMVNGDDKVLIVFGGEKQCYAAKNRAEYWAEGVQCWYDTNRTMDHDHNHIHTREQLIAYDPLMARLCKDVLGDSDWRFIPPRKRAGKDHLENFDPSQSPKVVDPEHIENAAYDYYDKYWKDYWQRLRDKHVAVAELTESAISTELPDPEGEPAAADQPVKVFILLGQSNMLGFGKVGSADKPGSLTHAVKDKQLYPYLIDNAGNWTERKDVRNVRVMGSGTGGMRVVNNEWLTIKGGNIGPEIGIGHHVGHATDAPVMLLKSCIGNRALGWDLLPPGGEGFEFTDDKGVTWIHPGYKGSPERWEKGTDPKKINWYAGMQYDGDISRAKTVLAELDKYYPGAKEYEVAGFFWWQGDRDSRSAALSSRYETNLVHLIKQLRKDFNAPGAKFVCASLGQTEKGATDGGGKILDAMLAVDGRSGKYPEFKDNVATVYSHPLSKGGSSGSHYNGNAETYMNVGEAMGQAMAELLKSDSE